MGSDGNQYTISTFLKYKFKIFHFKIKGVLAFFVIMGIFTIAAFNVTGVTVTKKVSSLARHYIL
jgi:hypothetical protein